MEYPVYYKDIKFLTVDGRRYDGFVEPPFTDEDKPFFVHTEQTNNKGCEPYSLYFDIDDIQMWEYIRK